MIIPKKDGISWIFCENYEIITIYENLFHKSLKYPRKCAFLSYNHSYE
jgi:hypothetical protein